MIKNRVYIIFEVVIGFFPILMFLVWGFVVWPGTVAMVFGGTAGMFETAIALGVPLGVLGTVGALILAVEVSYEDGEPYRYPRTTLLFVLFGIAAAVLAGAVLFFDGGWYSLVVIVPLMITAQLLWLGRKNLWSTSNKSFKPLAMLARTFGTPRLLGHGCAMLPEQALHAECRLTWR